MSHHPTLIRGCSIFLKTNWKLPNQEIFVINENFLILVLQITIHVIWRQLFDCFKMLSS